MRSRSASALAIGLGVLGGLVACNAILGNERKTLEPNLGDASADADAVIDEGEVSPDALVDTTPISCDGAVDSGTTALCEGKTVYVSPNGVDSNNGCSPCAPKLSLGSALQDLSDATDAGSIDGFQIEVCAGTYTQGQLTLSIPVSIQGGFDCSTWQPSSDATKTVFVNTSAATGSDTFVVRGATIGKSTVVNGMTFLANDANPGAAAVFVTAGAQPTLSNLVIQGGASAAGARSPASSYGLYVDNDSGGEIAQCQIHGGSGKGNGSLGLYVGDGGTPSIHDNTIDGGTGQSASYGAIGLYLQNVAPTGLPLPVQANKITGGTSATAVMGVFAKNGQVAFTGNEIHAGTVTGSTASSYGILTASDLVAASTVSLFANRIVGAIGGAESVGVRIGAGVSALQVTDNLIHGGEAPTTFGLEVESSNARISYNTIYGGSGVAESAALYVGSVPPPSATADYAVAESVLNNLLLGNYATKTATATGSVAIDSNACPAGSPLLLQIFKANVAAAVTNVAVYDTCGGEDVTVHGFELHVSYPGADVGFNLGIASSCSSDAGTSSSCAAIAACDGTDKNGCLSALLSGWTSADDGVGALFANPPGWSLNANVPCAIATGAPSGGGTHEDTDLLGNKRPSSGSAIGAIQSSACK